MQQVNYELRVGLFAIFALILFVWGWAWLKSFSLFHQPQRFVIRFVDVAGLGNAATINVQGVRVGNVEKIVFNAEKMVDVYVKITAETLKIPQGATATIQTVGLAGAKYIEITLPESQNGQQQPIPDGAIIRGEDPVRVELAINSIAKKLNRVFSHISADTAGQAIRNLSQASNKLSQNMDRLARASQSVEKTSQKFGHTAEVAEKATTKATKFFSDGSVTFTAVSDLAVDLKSTNAKVKKILDNPNFSRDLKDTVELARQTADLISLAITQVNSTLSDKPLRQELITMLSKLQQSTENVHKSMQLACNISSDNGFRSDLKEVVRTARDAMTKANNLLTDPQFKSDLKQTMSKVKAAAVSTDAAAQRLNQVLNKRAPLLRLFFGRPGYISSKKLESNKDLPPEGAPQNNNNNKPGKETPAGADPANVPNVP